MILTCLGDSLTYGYGVARPKVWTTLLAQRTGIDVRNRGINGDTTGGMLARFHRHVAEDGADAVLLMGGFNDLALGAGAGVVQANIFALVQHCVAARVRPLLGVPMPVHPPVTFAGLYSVDIPRACAAYAALCDWIRILAQDFSLPCVDFAQAVAALPSQTPDTRATLYTDGLHPSEAGHDLMARHAAHVLG